MQLEHRERINVNTRTKVISLSMTAILIALLMFGASVPANAQDATATATPAATQPAAKGDRGAIGVALARALVVATAQVTKLPNEQILNALRDGKTINQIVAEQKADPAAVQAAAKIILTTDITNAVAAGTMTQKQADKALPLLDKLISAAMDRKIMLPPSEIERYATSLELRILFEATAKASNISRRELLPLLRGGQTLAAIATAHNADPMAIITTATDQLTKAINQRVTAGKLSKEEGDRLIAALPAQLTELMNKVNPLDSKTHGKGKGTPQPTAPAADQPTIAATPAL